MQNLEPWQIANIDDDKGTCDIETIRRGNDCPEKGYIVARVSLFGPGDPGINASLIAAAPQMLEALKLSESMFDRLGFAQLRGLAYTDGEVERIRSAITNCQPLRNSP